MLTCPIEAIYGNQGMMNRAEETQRVFFCDILDRQINTSNSIDV